MSGKLARLVALQEQVDAATDRRRGPRHAIRAKAWLQSSGGKREQVAVIDVSSHGCAVNVEAAWLRAGSFVTVGIGEAPGLRAIIRWVRDGGAGMEFLGPIPPDRGEWHDLMDGPDT